MLKLIFDVVSFMPSDTLSLFACSPNIDKSLYVDDEMTIIDDLTGQEVWLILANTDSAEYNISSVEIQQFEEYEGLGIDNGRFLIKFIVPPSTPVINFDISIGWQDGGANYFNTQYLKNAYCTHRDLKIPNGAFEIEVFPYPNHVLSKVSFETNYLTTPVAVVDNKAVATGTVGAGTFFIKGTGTYEEPIEMFTMSLTGEVEGFTYEPKTFEKGSMINVEIVVDEGYILDRAKTYIKYNNSTNNFITSKASLSGALFPPTEVYSDVELFVAFVEEVVPVTNYVYVTGSFENCTCNYVDSEVTVLGKDIILTPNEGYEFKQLFTLVANTITSEFVKVGENLRFTVRKDYDYTLNEVYRAVKKVEQVGSFANLYKVNNQELNDLSKVRFMQEEDLGNFITNLYILPFKLPSTLLGDKSNIILGVNDTGVESTLINSYIYTLNVGEINVVEKYNNVYDYINTNYILHLPYFDKIYIDSEYIVNETLSIEYVVDLYNGSCTCNISSSFIDGVIESQTNLIITNLPFMQKSTNSVMSNISIINKNRINQAYVEVVRNKPYDTENLFGKQTIEFGVIGNYEGYIKCDNILLETVATNSEKEEIRKLLNGGVMV